MSLVFNLEGWFNHLAWATAKSSVSKLVHDEVAAPQRYQRKVVAAVLFAIENVEALGGRAGHHQAASEEWRQS